MDIEGFRKAGYQAIDRICDYYYSLQNKPVVPRVEPGYLQQHIPNTAPEKGEKWDVIADDYQKLILPGITHWQHPSWFAYFPTGGSFEAILGDLYATSTPTPGFNWFSGPACSELEAIVMDWITKLFDLDGVFLNSSGIGGGCLQVTASDSALISIVAARSTYMRSHPDVKMEELVIYTTTQTHSLGLKAGLVLGLAVRSLEVTASDCYSLRGHTLRAALEEDLARGRRPFILIATVGTTSSGAIDNLPEIHEVVKDHPSLWVHVDAAWAGVVLSCPEYRAACHLDEINSFANSFCTNFHKWGLVNFDASALWVRDRNRLTEALDITPPYLRTKQSGTGVIEFRNWHLGLGRRFRSLKLWFMLRGFGVEGFQKHIRHSVAMNQAFIKLVNASERFTIVTPPSFALTVLRIEPRAEKLSPEDLNSLNKLFYSKVEERKDIAVTHTILNGTYCIRFCTGSPHTTHAHIEQAFNLLSQTAKEAEEAFLSTK
ncbi:hypothetical protein FISHEDRAFT_68367 [Fistulina hepatica ATCC 64428]|uniref:Aromatic-L-amino-acid decarboxylase n=1 Tax=Fistulina hepatica ATCC 64428 TaxID=1128425 RepID=A0A0D7AQ49_9AGAR|nr:hypothetical protein FISHEDRAFT_68367 [Fistulina hepatica ATCC 64428]